MLVGIGPDQARIDGKAFTTDKVGRNAGLDDTFEKPAKDGAVAEPFVTSTRERRMILNLVLDREPAKPAIGEVYLI